jgi:cellulose biosynthesis protein BcsQ
MFTILSSPKGGTGTSVVAASLAIVSSSSSPTLLVDLAGDQAAILGLPQPPIGLSDWANGMTYREFDEIISLCHDNLCLAPTGTFDFETLNANAWDKLLRALSLKHSEGYNIIVDLGQADIPLALRKIVDTCYLVTRPCYLALRRAVDLETAFSGVIVVSEPDRVLTSRDVESVLKLKCVAEIPYTSEISRRVDSGLLKSRLPMALQSVLSQLISLEVSP